FENVWEIACGGGHLGRVLEEHNILSRATDLYDHEYGEVGIDFLEQKNIWDGDIITNPPYRFAQEFVEHSLELITDGHKVAMLLKIQFLEGKKRGEMYKKYPPKTVYVWPGRISCAMNGDFESIQHGSPMMFCWMIWKKGYHSDPIIKWIY
ncbi:MAG: NAD(P)-dependent oxidoreductase, partial [Nanoarchaeota archaeon]